MLTKERVSDAKNAAIIHMKKLIEKNPNIGTYEVTSNILDAKGIKTSPDNIKANKDKLNINDKKGIIQYKEAYDNAISDFNKGNLEKLVALPSRVVKTIAKGSGIGIGVAGVVNTLAPGLFNTALGYIAGAGTDLSLATKVGLVSMGIFSPPAVTSAGILAIGAVVGGVTYGAGKLTIKGVKSLMKGNKGSLKGEDR